MDTHTPWIQQAVRAGRVDLRKVLGEENPADLWTKHSNSRQRLGELVAIFGCKCLGGRAASAPQIRKGESSRVTMASAADGDLDDDEVAPVQGETSTCPCMPHLLYPVHELDARYPPLVAPPDEGLADATDDRRDAVYQHGLGIAGGIRAEVASQGRKRRPDVPSAAETPSIDFCTASTTSTPHRGNVKSYPRRGQQPYGRRGQCLLTSTTNTTGVTKPTTTKLTLRFASQARLPPAGAGRLSIPAWVCKPGAIRVLAGLPSRTS